MEREKPRLDKYLWAIRIFKTRSLAADACNANKVKLNGQPVKPAKSVSVGDDYEVKTESRKWLIKVTGLLQQRVPFSEAVKFYLDLTPEEELNKPRIQVASFHTGKRLSKIGRPTKKQKRDLDEFLSDD
ncbi:MAG: RNA-binding S4 domain-containing protein [Chitinophagaceae bacterium]|nr:RNA-binding S4 domain-containing protein [Bacteroidota bacterium]MCC6257116.1 RNA-binding S4 domain-containing protein [Chitinophagaceae bacterium]MCW5916265.1 RNA-binding S4 domain-containing protein [Ferruginibacter sp.]